MAETYTNGVWIVKPGEEDAFVSAWREFASWGHTRPGCGTLRLVRDTSEASRYMSFGAWESFEAQRAWKDDPEFRNGWRGCSATWRTSRRRSSSS